MARVGISITKRISFRDSLQEFSNVYFYEHSGIENVATADAAMDELVSLEAAVHSTNVTIIRGRYWTAGGSPSSNQMISQKTYTTVGALSPIANMDRERAYLISWPAGLDSRGHPVFLRKWYHTGAAHGGVGITAALLEQTTGFTTANRTAIANALKFGESIGAGTYTLCAESGRAKSGNAVAHKYLEHHQLGDMWRAT